jgi:hypothetical protein
MSGDNTNKQADGLNAQLATLEPKTKTPTSMAILNKWIAQAEQMLGAEVKGGRLGWLVASSVAIAAVQRVVDASGQRLFLVKGGTLLLYRLNTVTRPTKDVDGMVRGDLDEFFEKLDEVLEDPWGPLELRRGEIEIIQVPEKIVKPRRFEITISFKGATWRRIVFEVSPDEAGISKEPEELAPPALRAVGLPDPETMVGIALRFQIAQKLHAVSSPHDPPKSRNDRARDVVDLILLQRLVVETGSPSLPEIRAAALELFASRKEEAEQMGFTEHEWPCKLTAYPHWIVDYQAAADSVGVGISLDDAIEAINAWMDEIDAA